MAYEINQRTEADYRFFRFENRGSVLDELNHNLKITDGVLRFRIFKVDPRAPVIDPPPPTRGRDGLAARPAVRARRRQSAARGPDPRGARGAAAEAEPAPGGAAEPEPAEPAEAGG